MIELLEISPIDSLPIDELTKEQEARIIGIRNQFTSYVTSTTTNHKLAEESALALFPECKEVKWVKSYEELEKFNLESPMARIALRVDLSALPYPINCIIGKFFFEPINYIDSSYLKPLLGYISDSCMIAIFVVVKDVLGGKYNELDSKKIHNLTNLIISCFGLWKSNSTLVLLEKPKKIQCNESEHATSFDYI